MFTAERYVRPATLQEALELNRKRSSTILGGGCWLRLGRKRIGTLIDLSGLGLDQIEERDGWVRIGAMVSLRQLETSALLKERFGSLFADMTGHEHVRKSVLHRHVDRLSDEIAALDTAVKIVIIRPFHKIQPVVSRRNRD